jgi:hypothetical protein
MAIVLEDMTGPTTDVRIGEEFTLTLKVRRGAPAAPATGDVTLKSGDPTYAIEPARVSVSIPDGKDAVDHAARVKLIGPAVAEETVVAIDGLAGKAQSTSVTVVK